MSIFDDRIYKKIKHIFLEESLGSNFDPNTFGFEISDEIPIAPSEITEDVDTTTDAEKGEKLIQSIFDDVKKKTGNDSNKIQAIVLDPNFDIDSYVEKYKTSHPNVRIGLEALAVANENTQKAIEREIERLIRSKYRLQEYDVASLEQEAIKNVEAIKTFAREILKKYPPLDDTKFTPAERPQRIIHNSALKGIIKKDGNKIDSQKLKDIMLKEPDSLFGLNEKMEKSGYNFYKYGIAAFQGLYYDIESDSFKLIKTCPNADECKKVCYATLGNYVQYDNHMLYASRILTLLMNNTNKFKNKFINDAKKIVSSDIKTYIRLHDSGDLFSGSYLQFIIDCINGVNKAVGEDKVTFYSYTKMISMVRAAKDKIPNNCIFTFSEGGLESKVGGRNIIDKNSERYSVIVPTDVWKSLKSDLLKRDGKKIIPPKPRTLNKLKEIISFHYNLDSSTVISYASLLRKPENDKKVNVFIVPGVDGDIAAVRKDVLGIYLLEH